MANTPDKGKFSATIDSDVIDDAVRAVDKRAQGPEGEAVDVEATGEASPEAEALNQDLQDLQAQLELSQAKGREMMERIKDTHEKMLRAVADLDNFKKRAQKEKEEIQRYGSERLLKDLLPIPDNLDRALDHAKTAADFDGLKQGLQMTRKLFEDTLGRHGVKTFSAVGQPFDPRLHEAMQHIETSDMPPGMVAAEVLRGYMLNDRLVRPALVMISKAPEPADGGAAKGGESGGGAGSAPE